MIASLWFEWYHINMKPIELINELPIEKNTCGIYMIYCENNGSGYVGQSKDIKQRWRVHTCSLRKGNHGNPRLQRTWDKYGDLKLFLLEVVELEKLTEREEYYAGLLDRDLCMNLREVGESYERTDEMRLRSSLARKGIKGVKRTMTEEWKEAIIKRNKEQVWTDEMREKLSQSRKDHRDVAMLEVVKKIKEELALGVSQKDIAIKYKVDSRRVSDIKCGRKWKDV